jgi:hypothetical protein
MAFDLPTFHELQDHFPFFALELLLMARRGKLKSGLPGVL